MTLCHVTSRQFANSIANHFIYSSIEEIEIGQPYVSWREVPVTPVLLSPLACGISRLIVFHHDADVLKYLSDSL